MTYCGLSSTVTEKWCTNNMRTLETLAQVSIQRCKVDLTHRSSSGQRVAKQVLPLAYELSVTNNAKMDTI